MRLSRNLTYSEIIESISATKLGIENIPSREALVNLTIIANTIFQPLRDWLGGPLYVTSGYRSPDLNVAIGGSSNSQHCTGQAFDLNINKSSKRFDNSDIFRYIADNLEFDQLIWEFGDESKPDWVHVSYNVDSPNRKQILIAIKEDGKTKYKIL